MILQMGFPGYFLVTADLIGWAKAQGIRVGPGRGSATGSIVSYAMGITELDPLEHSLLFERFLNPDRVSMPDIDIDFDERRRGEVLRYVTEKYGADRVAQVVTYGTIKTKQALKDASRVLGFPFSMGDRVTKALPPSVMAKDVPLAKLFDPTHERYKEGGEFRALVEADPDVKTVYETGKGLEGLKRQWGVHACAVIMSSEPLLDHIPLMRREQDGAIITQFDYPTCETLGLLKMDFLGLRNLTVIDDAVTQHPRPTAASTSTSSRCRSTTAATYELLARGDTLGVFQLDGGPMRSLLRSLAPTAFGDIAAVLALYRPGPMAANAHTDYAERKNGRQQSRPIHPELAEPLAEILDETYGLVVYQEQVQAIARKVAGYTLGQADLLRRAMGKKKKAELDAQLENFSAGMRANGFSEGAITALWNTLLPFCDYGFNKSHTAGYGMVSYWTAYLKANYPAEYMAALLTSVKDDKDKMAVYLAECRRMGIKVLPPCVNESAADFTPVGTDIRFGLAAIRNVGANVVSSHRAGARGEGCVRRLPRLPGQGRRGGVQQAGHRGADQGRRVRLPRSSAARADELLRTGRRRRARHQAGRGDRPVRPVRRPRCGRGRRRRRSRSPSREGEWDKRVLLQFEREMLGLYVSDHPLFGLEHVLARAADTSIANAQADGAEEPKSVDARRHPVHINRRVTKAGAAVGAGDAGGPRRLDRGHVLPADLRAGRADDRRRRHRRHPWPHRRPRGGGEAHRERRHRARHHRGPARPGRGQHAAGSVHAADGRAAQGGAGHPPRHDRGAPAPGQRRRREAAAPRRRLPGRRLPGADGRPQGAGRPVRRLGLGPRTRRAAHGRFGSSSGSSDHTSAPDLPSFRGRKTSRVDEPGRRTVEACNRSRCRRTSRIRARPTSVRSGPAVTARATPCRATSSAGPSASR